MGLIESLIKDGWLKTPEIISAFKSVKRADFLPDGIKDMAELNEAIPIGYGQTISQPLTVAFMIEALSPKSGNKILDIGSGSGYTTALLANLAGEKGKVIGVELIEELKRFGEENAAKYGYVKSGNAEFVLADGNYGYEKESPYDRILVSASADSVPEKLKEQLKIGGKIVIPVKNSIKVLVKIAEDKFTEEDFPGFIFVPLVSEK